MGLRNLLSRYSRDQVKISLYVAVIFAAVIGVVTVLSALAVRSAGGIDSSGTRFDGTTAETAEESCKQMATELPDRQQADRFKAALSILFDKQAAIDGTTEAEADDVDRKRINHNWRKELHGLTVRQIVKKANATPEEEAKVIAQIRLQDAHLDRLIALHTRLADTLRESTDLMLAEAPAAKIEAADLKARQIKHEIDLENLEYKRDAAAIK